MTGASHRIVGMAAGFSLAAFTSTEIWQYPLFIMLGGLGALLPDVDHRKSHAGQIIPLISIPLSWFFEHRGITHSATFVVFCVFLMQTYYPNQAWIYAILIGYVSHIFSDMLTAKGVRLFWPLKSRIGIPLITTGNTGESFIVALIVAGLIMYPYHNQIIKIING